MWQALFGNLALVALVVSTWVHAEQWLENRRRIVRLVVMGLLMGFGAIASMLLSVRLENGMMLDLRMSLIALGSFFGGPVAALLSLTIAAGCRLAMGGAAAPAGITGMAATAAAAVLGYYTCGRGKPSWPKALAVSLLSAVVPMAGMLVLPHEVATGSLSHLGLPILLLDATVIFGASCLMLQGIQLSEERILLRAALAQAPDFLYVKNTRSELVTVNHTVAAFNGFARPEDMRGKTDFDLGPADHAQALFDAEREIMRTGHSIADVEEHLVGTTGESRWFSTSKTPIRNPDGEVIGIAGVTKDISGRKRLETELVESRNQLSYVLTEMSDGLALFDQNGILVFCNERYSAGFPLTASERTPGRHIRDILRAVAETGEQRDIPVGGGEAWVERIAGDIHVESEQEVNLADGRWMQIRTRPTSDGWSVVVVSDVTTIKQAEVALLGLTDQLKLLATTDSLTGLLNRRAFDEALDLELARSTREHTSISLLLVDVDRFKAYNDLYGHPAGDTCLKALSKCIASVVRRPADVAARYGGEEFVIILPNTNEDGAFAVAEQLRTALRALDITHDGSEKKVVTVSVGIASYTGSNARRRSTELIIRADEALYIAKEAGRDRATGWRAKHPVAQRANGAV